MHFAACYVASSGFVYACRELELARSDRDGFGGVFSVDQSVKARRTIGWLSTYPELLVCLFFLLLPH
jgi:hypothetical protein